MRHQRLACLGNHAPESPARESEAPSDLYLPDPTASEDKKLATLGAVIKHAPVEVLTYARLGGRRREPEVVRQGLRMTNPSVSPSAKPTPTQPPIGPLLPFF
jgi:hypothetical protein